MAEVGAGEGFFAVRLAHEVGPKGRVFAVDVSDKAVSALGRRASAASLLQVQPVLGAADDPHLPNSALDATLVVNSYHEMPAHEGMLNRISAVLKPGGRLVLVEPWAKARRGEPRADQVKDHLIAPELAEEELRRAGFTSAGARTTFSPGRGRRSGSSRRVGRIELHRSADSGSLT